MASLVCLAIGARDHLGHLPTAGVPRLLRMMLTFLQEVKSEGYMVSRGFGLEVTPYYFCHNYCSKQVARPIQIQGEGKQTSTLNRKTCNGFVVILNSSREVRT